MIPLILLGLFAYMGWIRWMYVQWYRWNNGPVDEETEAWLEALRRV